MNKRMTVWALGLAALGSGAGGSVAAEGGNLPLCDAGPDQVVECTGPVTLVQLDGTNSIDPLGGTLSFRWEVDPNPRVTITGELTATPTLSFDMAGTCIESVTAFLIVKNAVGPSVCTTNVTVGDFTAPRAACPPNVALQPGDSTAPSATGFPVILDDCNPNPTVTWNDTLVGDEKIIRVWRITDGCNRTSCVQELFFVSDGFAHVDFLPGQCPNGLNVGGFLGGGTFGGGVLGNAIDSTTIDLPTITVSRVDFFQDTPAPVGPTVSPVSATLNDVGTPFIGDPCECTGLGPDGTIDVDLLFDLQEFVTVLGLDQLPNGTEVPLLVRGQFLDGSVFEGVDCVVITGN